VGSKIDHSLGFFGQGDYYSHVAMYDIRGFGFFDSIKKLFLCFVEKDY